MKILYLMAIDWHWIKQRPQFLALELNKDCKVDVFYLSEFLKKSHLQCETDAPDVCKKIWALPLRDRNIIFSFIEKILFRFRIGSYNKYDIVWMGYPAFFKYIPKKYSGKIIYDCMDNYSAMCGNQRIRKTLSCSEVQLVEKAEIIFVSSRYLFQHIVELGGEKKTFLLRNGFEQTEVRIRVPASQKKDNYKIGYIGTVAEWFDITLLLNSLMKINGIEYHIAGPVSDINLSQNQNIVYDGIVEHSRLYDYSEQLDCLIMPFIVNDIVEAVDPVKLYEYISMGKCIISVFYEEIERFEPYVYFYKDQESYLKLLERLVEEGFPPKYNQVQQETFLKENTWKARSQTMHCILYEK